MSYASTYSQLLEMLSSAKELLADGDLENARVYADRARSINSRISRRQRRLARYSADEWMQQQNFSNLSSEEVLLAVNKIAQCWEDIARWLDIVIASVGIGELLRTTAGINILLDRELKSDWDFGNDIAVITGKNSNLVAEALIARGQILIITMGHENLETSRLIREITPSKSAEFSSSRVPKVLQVSNSSLLSDSQLAACASSELPSLLHVSSEANDLSPPNLENLYKQIESAFILNASQHFLPVVFSEHFIGNLPAIRKWPSVSDLEHIISGQAVMIAAPGPSLIETLPHIYEQRKHFILISYVRSLPVLLDFGIVPDFAIMADASDHTSAGLDLISENSRYSRVPLIVVDYAHKSTFESEFQEFFLIPTAELIGSPLSVALHGYSPPVCVGTGVAAFTVCLAAELQASSITLVGQDLSISERVYASYDQEARRLNDGNLTCTSITGEQIPTQADYLYFIEELEFLASKYSTKVNMINSTAYGAFLRHWEHIPLDSRHPVVVDASKKILNLQTLQPHSHSLRGGSRGPTRDISEAIKQELSQVKSVEFTAGKLVDDLQSMLIHGSDDYSELASAEMRLQEQMNTSGSLIKFYCLPSKREADAALKSVQDLNENLLVSLDYYMAVRAQARRIIQMFNDVEASLDGVTT